MFLLITSAARALENPEYDVAVREKHEFYIRERDTTYELTSRDKVTATFVSERSVKRLEDREFFEYESYFDKITYFQSSCDCSRGDVDVNIEYPESQDAFLSSWRYRRITAPPTIHVGESISYSDERSYHSMPFFPILHVRNINRLEEYEAVIHHPDDVKVTFDVVFSRDSIPYTIEQADDETHLIFKSVPYVSPLEYFNFNYTRAFIQVIVRRKDGRAITPSTPEEFSHWYFSMFSKDSVLTRKEVDILKPAVEKATTAREKLGVIHDYVRRTIRYIGDEKDMGAFVPRRPGNVLERGYGDCKDRAYLVASLAQYFGIKGVSVALVHTRPQPHFPNSHVYQFNHVIVAYEEKGQLEFFDPTSKYCEFGNIPDGDIEGRTLVLQPDHPRLASVTAANDHPSIEMNISASFDSLSHGQATVILRNDYLVYARYALEQLSGAAQQNHIADMVADNLNKIVLGDYTVVSESDSAIIFQAKADLSKFIVSSSSRVYVPQTAFRTATGEMVQRGDDSWDLHMNSRALLSLSLTLQTPGYTTKAMDTAYGKPGIAAYKVSLQPQQDGAHIDYSYKQLRKQFSGSNKQQFLEFGKQYLASKKSMFIFTHQ